MALANYSELQTEISNYLHRSDLTSQLPAFIQLAEAKLNDELRVRSMITEATVTVHATNNYVALPTGYREPISFTNDLGEEVVQVHFDDLTEMRYNASSQRPEYWAETSRVEFERPGGAAYNYTMIYYKALDLASDTTNSVLTNYPGLYLFGSLLQAAPFIQDDNRMALWGQMYNDALRKANNRAQQSLKTLRTEFPIISNSYDINRGY